MALRNSRPLTPTLRFKSLPMFQEVTKSKPVKSLVEPKKRTGGRNNHGRLTSRHIGGGHKQKYRIVDFKRKVRDVEATVEGIEYDPNRSARIALLVYGNGEKAYILAPNGLRVGAKVVAGETAPPEVGNALPLKAIPLGTVIHNVEIIPGRGGQVARSAGQQAVLNNREAGYALVRLPSGEIRRINENAYATVGQVGNTDHMNISSGKAGRTRWLGRRSRVRGMAMNPIDHPHGGGEGRSKGNHPQTPWGMPTKGYKTRHNKRTNRFIVMRRKK